MPEEFAGVEIAVEAGSPTAALVQRLDAVAVRMPDLSAATGAVVVDEWLLDDLGLVDSGITLAEAKHVMAVPPGENGWQVRLERFLFTNQPLVADLLQRAPAPW